MYVGLPKVLPVARATGDGESQISTVGMGAAR